MLLETTDHFSSGEISGKFKEFFSIASQKLTLFFSVLLRWRHNAREYAVPFSKKGLLRGYIKYGIFSYVAWYYITHPSELIPFKKAHHGDEHH